MVCNFEVKMYNSKTNEVVIDLYAMIFKRMRNFIKEWETLILTLFRRFYSGFRYVNFVFYFITVIGVLGGLGVWKEYLESSSEEIINHALTTFYMAVLATSSADLILKTKPKKEMKVLKMPALSILMAGGVCAVLIFTDNAPDYLAKLCTVISLFFWWITNSTDKKYSSGKFKPFSTVGGHVEVEEPVSNNDDNNESQFEGIEH